MKLGVAVSARWVGGLGGLGPAFRLRLRQGSAILRQRWSEGSKRSHSSFMEYSQLLCRSSRCRADTQSTRAGVGADWSLLVDATGHLSQKADLPSLSPSL